TAVDKSGKSVEGRIVAVDLHEVAQLLRGAGLSATRVDAIGAPVVQTQVAMVGAAPVEEAPVRTSAYAPIDLTQPVVAMPTVLAQAGDTASAQERLEPWQRGGPVQQMSPPETTQPMSVPHALSPAGRAELSGGRERAQRMVVPTRQTSVVERFKEMFVYPVTS